MHVHHVQQQRPPPQDLSALLRSALAVDNQDQPMALPSSHSCSQWRHLRQQLQRTRIRLRITTTIHLARMKVGTAAALTLSRLRLQRQRQRQQSTTIHLLQLLMQEAHLADSRARDSTRLVEGMRAHVLPYCKSVNARTSCRACLCYSLLTD